MELLINEDQLHGVSVGVRMIPQKLHDIRRVLGDSPEFLEFLDDMHDSKRSIAWDECCLD
jgi:hypothetical protein